MCSVNLKRLSRDYRLWRYIFYGCKCLIIHERSLEKKQIKAIYMQIMQSWVTALLGERDLKKENTIKKLIC